MKPQHNPSTLGAEALRFLNFRPAWPTEQIPRQPGLQQRNPISKEQKREERSTVLSLEELILDSLQTELTRPYNKLTFPMCVSFLVL